MGKNGYRCITFAQIQVCPNRTQMSSKLHPRFNTSQWPIPFLFEFFIVNENEHDRLQNKLRVKRDDRHPHNIDETIQNPTERTTYSCSHSSTAHLKRSSSAQHQQIVTRFCQNPLPLFVGSTPVHKEGPYNMIFWLGHIVYEFWFSWRFCFLILCHFNYTPTFLSHMKTT